jgi:hypothetical protein
MKLSEKVYLVKILNLATGNFWTESIAGASPSKVRAKYLVEHPAFANIEKYKVTAKLDRDCDLNYL